MSQTTARPSRAFADVVGSRVILLDGAIGTELYRRGMFINRSYDQLNLVAPEVVRGVHKDYLRAGAEILTTNTFGANRFRLRAYGIEAQVADIAAAGVRLAREVAGDKAWVAGSVGPTGRTLAPLGQTSPGDAYSAFREAANAMADQGPDLFLLETFLDLGELWQAFRACRDVAPHIPVVTSVSFKLSFDGEILCGKDPETVARTMTGWGPVAVGVNCSHGPRALLPLVEAMARATSLPLLAYSNAGLPQEVEGRSIYLAGPEYMAEYARRFVQKGAWLVGGCCGTGPEHIKEMRSFVRSVSPGMAEVAAVHPGDGPEVPAMEPVPVVERSELAAKLYGGHFTISVELDPPRGLDPQRSLDGARYLRANGIDVVNIADGPRAVARMGPMAMAQLVDRYCGMKSVIHYCCRDRNLLGMQMDLLGAHALGMHNVLAVTGDPPKMGSFPDATAVFDIDSIGLITFVQRMNRGQDFSGSPIGDGQTHFFVGAGCNPAHVDLDLEVERFGRKIEAGAEFFFSQPVYDLASLEHFLERTEQFPKVPFLVGILPLASLKNAEFLHNEVPGMQVPQDIRDRLRAAPDKAGQRRVGIEVAQEALVMAKGHPRIRGAYVYPPFGSYKAVLRVCEVLEDVRPDLSAAAWRAREAETGVGIG